MKNKKTLTLLDNIQFIYELALARLELRSFEPGLKVTNDFREFEIKEVNNLKNLKSRLAYFKALDNTYTDYYYLQKYNQTKSVNQFLTHWIYPYKGKFHPQMIRALLNIIGMKKGETLLDPFVGSGTAILEAQLLDIDGIGIDISPLCVLISKVKTESVDALNQIKEFKDYYLKRIATKKRETKKLRIFIKWQK